MSTSLLQQLTSFMKGLQNGDRDVLVSNLEDVVEYLAEKVSICEEILEEETGQIRLYLSDAKKGRLVQAGRELASTYAYIGNHTTSTVNPATTTYTANALNQYSQISVLSVHSVENLSYDLDGNMLSGGVFSYAYDAENRLVAAYSNSVCVISNAYDHASRRVAKWTPSHTTTFIYDGWNLVQETIATTSGVTTNRYVWGNDLSGTTQGTGAWAVCLLYL